MFKIYNNKYFKYELYLNANNKMLFKYQHLFTNTSILKSKDIFVK